MYIRVNHPCWEHASIRGAERASESERQKQCERQAIEAEIEAEAKAEPLCTNQYHRFLETGRLIAGRCQLGAVEAVGLLW